MRQPNRTKSELGLRIVSGLAMAIAALGVAWLGGVVFSLFWLAAAIAVAVEWSAMTGLRPRGMVLGLSVVGLASAAAVLVGHFGFGSGLSVAAATCLAITLVTRRARDRVWGITGYLYAASVAIVPVVMRESYGLAGVLWMFAAVWTTDVAAFFVGRRIGGPKLWPAVSPGKTWSGFAGGLAGGTAAAAAIVLHATGSVGSGLMAAIVSVSALASVTSQLGDLAESAMKRHFVVKDSGHLIPGHGGAMDRLDGFAAVALVCGLALMGARLADH